MYTAKNSANCTSNSEHDGTTGIVVHDEMLRFVNEFSNQHDQDFFDGNVCGYEI